MPEVAVAVLARKTDRALCAITTTLAQRRADVVSIACARTPTGEHLAVQLVLDVTDAGGLERIVRWLNRIVDVVQVEQTADRPLSEVRDETCS